VSQAFDRIKAAMQQARGFEESFVALVDQMAHKFLEAKSVGEAEKLANEIVNNRAELMDAFKANPDEPRPEPPAPQ